MSKSILTIAIAFLCQSAFALNVSQSFQFDHDEITLKGVQRVSTYSSFSADKTNTKNYAFETSITKMEFRGSLAAGMTETLLNHKNSVTREKTVMVDMVTNFSAIGEKIRVQCALDSVGCEVLYFSPKKGDHDGGLPGSGRINAFEKKSLKEAMEFAKEHTLVADFFGGSQKVETYQDEVELKFDRKQLEDIMEPAGVCESKFFSGGGVYGPGNSICFTNLAL